MAGLPVDIRGSKYSLETAGHHLVGAASLRVQHHLQKTDWRDRLNLAFVTLLSQSQASSMNLSVSFTGGVKFLPLFESV